MPDCVAPGCDLGRKSCLEKRAAFSFPGDSALLAQWIRSLRRPGFIPSPHSRVCEVHFEERYIVRLDRIRQRDGSVVERQRKRVDLTPDAVPTLFPSSFAVTTPAGKTTVVPKYLSKKPAAARKCPDERRKAALEKRTADESAKTDLRRLHSFAQLVLFLRDPKMAPVLNPKGWYVVISERIVNICRLVRGKDSEMFLQMDVEVGHDMTPVIRRFEKRGCSVTRSTCRTAKTLTTKDDVVAVLSLNDHLEETPTVKETVHEIARQMELLASSDSHGEEEKAKVAFLMEQVQFLACSERGARYSPEMYAWAAALYTKSPAGYRFLRNTSALTLPGESTLREVLKPYKSEPGLTETQLSMIERLATKHQEPRQRIISLHLDEISVRPAYDYKAGKVSGQAHNGDGPATEILGFMVSGLLCGIREMVSLLPVRNATADEIYWELMSVMLALEERGFAVVVLITDNHKKNQRLYSIFCGQCGHPDQSSNIPHLLDPQRLLFLLLDTVHIVKCLRNNWFNKGDLMYPDLLPFFCHGDLVNVKTCVARWVHLSYAYSLEQSRSLRVTQLTETAVAPNNLEKQNVNLALQVFCEKTARGLEILSKEFSGNAAFKDVTGSVNFIDAVIRLWRMWNIQRIDQHKRFLLPEMKPFESQNDDRFSYMDCFLAWVRVWESWCHGGRKSQSLTVDTFKSLSRTLDGMQKLIKYLLSDCGAKFVLTGKISNDVIEGRFRSYRNLSGSSYLVSVTEVIECQGRLQLLGHLRAHKVLFGSSKFEPFPVSNDPGAANEAAITEWFWANVDSAKDFPQTLTPSENSAFLFVSGYCAFKIVRKIACETCIGLLKCTDDLEYQLDPTGELVAITGLNRGKLSYPTGFTRTVTRYCYYIFSIFDNSKR